MDEDIGLIDMTVTIVTAFVGANRISTDDLQSLIHSTYLTLKSVSERPNHDAREGARKPAVPVKKSKTDQWLVCLEDGKKFKSLKRHLTAHHGLSPAEYREKWGLPNDYPMVAPAYTETRSRLAVASGLGKKRKGRRSRSS